MTKTDEAKPTPSPLKTVLITITDKDTGKVLDTYETQLAIVIAAAKTPDIRNQKYPGVTMPVP